VPSGRALFGASPEQQKPRFGSLTFPAPVRQRYFRAFFRALHDGDTKALIELRPLTNLGYGRAAYAPASTVRPELEKARHLMLPKIWRSKNVWPMVA
jgi:hypothetical protein